jgi:uncharacterized protein (DUF302 family)
MSINFRKQFHGSFDDTIDLLTKELEKEGFGILTRIDLHKKIKEKLGKDISPAVILGACNPELAYEAYHSNTDVASLLPCNAVVREVGPDIISVELIKPTFLMSMLGEKKLIHLAEEADRRLKRVLDKLSDVNSEKRFRSPDTDKGEPRAH